VLIGPMQRMNLLISPMFQGLGLATCSSSASSAASNHLTWNSLVPVSVKLMVSNGWVTLQGTAEWQFQKEDAARVVRYLQGVKAVTNEIDLKPTVTATGIKSKIEEALRRDARIEARDIIVETSMHDGHSARPGAFVEGT